MSEKKLAVKTKERKNLADGLDEVAKRSTAKNGDGRDLNVRPKATKKTRAKVKPPPAQTEHKSKEYDDRSDSTFEAWDNEEFEPQDYDLDVPVDSLESAVGYTSLFRQMHKAFLRMAAFYRSSEGGSYSPEEARARAFHACTDKEDAKKRFRRLMRFSVENLHFADMLELHSFAPRVAERFWEKAKIEGRKEFASGHLAANISFPVGYQKTPWNIARYLGVRESFINEWKPKGGIEVSMIDMLTQAYFQWQYWLEQTVKRSQTREREEHPEYSRFMARREAENRAPGWTDGHWNRPYVTEQQALEHAVQMADRWNRIYMRTLRQLRDLRRYAQVTINNPNQVNIAGDGGQQVNVSKT